MFRQDRSICFQVVVRQTLTHDTYTHISYIDIFGIKYFHMGSLYVISKSQNMQTFLVKNYFYVENSCLARSQNLKVDFSPMSRLSFEKAKIFSATVVIEYPRYVVNPYGKMRKHYLIITNSRRNSFCLPRNSIILFTAPKYIISWK